MKAWICRGYGGPAVLALEDRPLPGVKDNEVLVKIRATTVSSGDMRLRALKMPQGFGLIARPIFGFIKPRQPILGTEFAGTIKAVGKEVSSFKPGDDVFGFPGGDMGCHAEYRAMPITKPLALKPDNVSFEEAASLSFGGSTALHFLREAKVHEGETVLVIGASGTVGSAMVQLARDMGATVTGVTSTRNIDLVRSLGAVAVIDYAQQDFTKESETYDVIADCVGASSFAECIAVLNEHGRYLCVSGGLWDLFARPSGTKRSIGGPASERPEDITQLAGLAGSGAFKPLIDRTYDFQDLPEAHAYVEAGHKRGSVVVVMPVTDDDGARAPSS